MMKLLITFSCLCLFSLSASAKGTYMQPAKFIAKAFEQSPPQVQVYTHSAADAKAIGRIQQRQVSPSRTRYWKQGNKTVWVLKHIGKTHPITAGFVIEDGKLIRTKVLVFKETRGWEIRFKYFTEQFDQAELIENYKLDRGIDNISGATLSVRAMKKMARIALYLDRQVADNVASIPSNQNNEQTQETTP